MEEVGEGVEVEEGLIADVEEGMRKEGKLFKLSSLWQIYYYYFDMRFTF